MIKFKKVLTIRITNFLVTAFFLLSNSAYSIPVDIHDNLRVPMGSANSGMKKAIRLVSNKTADSIINEEEFAIWFLKNEVRRVFGRILKGGASAAKKRINSKVKIKGDATPATYYDVMIEKKFRALVARKFPGYGVLAEELKDLKEWAQILPNMFTLDPIDGTLRFLEMGRHFGTLAGYYKNQNPQFGMGYWPLLDLDGSGSTLLEASAGKKEVFLNGKAVEPRPDLMNKSNVVIIGAHPKVRKAMKDALRAYFEAKGMKVIDSAASGGEIAEMMFKGTARLFIHLNPAGVDAPTNGFIARKLGFKVSDRFGNDIFPLRFEYLRERLFFDSLIVGTSESHEEALKAFKEIGNPEDPLRWTTVEQNMDPVKAINHYNELVAHQDENPFFELDPSIARKKEAKVNELRQETGNTVRPVAKLIQDNAESELELLVQEAPYKRAVLDPKKGALKDIVVIYKEKKKSGKSAIVAEGGPPGAGKTVGGANLARAISKLTNTITPIIKEDTFMWQRNLRGKGLEGKFQLAERDRVIYDLGQDGRSVFVPIFDDVSGGNVLFALNKENDLVIYNGNRTITVNYRPGENYFTYNEILRISGEEPVNLSMDKPHVNISDSGVFISGSTKIRIRVKGGKLVAGIQNMEIIGIKDGKQTLIEQLTEHEFDLANKKIRILLPPGQRHLDDRANYDLVKVEDPKTELIKAKACQAMQFLQAGTPLIIEGQFVFVKVREGIFGRSFKQYDVRINYRTNRLGRWARDMNRSYERGRTKKEVDENINRFYERAFTEEAISVPSGADKTWVIQVNTTDHAESIERLILYGQENFPMYHLQFEHLGIDPDTIDGEQRKKIDEPIIKTLLKRWKDSFRFVRTIDGIDEYEIGEFLLRVDSGKDSLSDANIQQNQELRNRANKVMGGNSLVDLSSLGAIFGGRRLGYVSLWNKGSLLGERLRELAVKEGEESLREGENLIDGFIQQEQALHRRGIVDANPDIMEHRRLLPIRGEVTVAVVSPEASLKTGHDAMGLYRDLYIADQNGSNIYLSPALVSKIPEKFREYYQQRVKESLANKTLRAFFMDEFEIELSSSKRIPVSMLPMDLKDSARPKTDIVPVLVPLRTWGVEHPEIYGGRINHIRYLYDKYLIKNIKEGYFDKCKTQLGTPQLTWAALFVTAYPDQYAKFYTLISLFYEGLLSDPYMLERPQYISNGAARKLIEREYQKAYISRGIRPPKIELNTWKAFYAFLNEARLLGSSWEKKSETMVLREEGKDRDKIEIKDQREYERLMAYLNQPKKAVFSDFDGTITKAENDPLTRKTVVKKGFRRVHKQIINKLAQTRNLGIVVAIATNRRLNKMVDYCNEILKRLKRHSAPEGAFELYFSSSMKGMNAESMQEFKEFALIFPKEEQDEIIKKLIDVGVLRSDRPEHVERMEEKINLYVPKDVERNVFLSQIYSTIAEYLKKDMTSEYLSNNYIRVKIVDAGEDVITIIPLEADKVRAKEFVKKRHGLRDDEILILVDQPQPGAIDELLSQKGGVTVGEENPDIPSLISTKKAIGLEGPEAALWVLEHTNFIPKIQTKLKIEKNTTKTATFL